jgi:hypothetical protein
MDTAKDRLQADKLNRAIAPARLGRGARLASYVNGAKFGLGLRSSPAAGGGRPIRALGALEFEMAPVQAASIQ